MSSCCRHQHTAQPAVPGTAHLQLKAILGELLGPYSHHLGGTGSGCVKAGSLGASKPYNSCSPNGGLRTVLTPAFNTSRSRLGSVSARWRPAV